MINSNLLKCFTKKSKVLLTALVLTIIVFQLSELNYIPLKERVIKLYNFRLLLTEGLYLQVMILILFVKKLQVICLKNIHSLKPLNISQRVKEQNGK